VVTVAKVLSRYFFITLFCATLTNCIKNTPDHQQLVTARPNVLLILADDLGFSDLGAYGSEIPTPNIDALAKSGALLTNFYANATCAPSRSMLLSGMDSHSVGFGFNPIAAQRLPVLRGQPGYSGKWPDHIDSFVENFTSAGYYSVMAGKWHQGSAKDSTPYARGFRKAFYLEEGGASHFADAAGQTSAVPIATYYEDDKLVDSLPDDFYSTRFYVDKLINYIENREQEEINPFFAYLAFTAPHWPLQIPADWENKFNGVYSDGWEAVRARRIESAKNLGLLSKNAEIPPFPKALGSWSELSSEVREREARRMELYAAMIAYLDSEVGRLINYLKATNQYDDTLIVFLSDNGPEGNDIENGLADNRDWLPSNFDQSFENMGKANSYVTLSRGWAHVSAGPLNQYKSFLGEGGVRVPAIISLPNSIQANSRMDSLTSIMDIAPTLMEFANVPSNQNYEIQGRSAAHRLRDPASIGKVRDSLAMESYGNKATWENEWKLLWNWELKKWELFNLLQDPGETNDLSMAYPVRVKNMIRTFSDFAEANGVVVLDSEVGYARYADQIDNFSSR
jgi:arylsulfatase A-like enzyme